MEGGGKKKGDVYVCLVCGFQEGDIGRRIGGERTKRRRRRRNRWEFRPTTKPCLVASSPLILAWLMAMENDNHRRGQNTQPTVFWQN